MPLFFDLYGRDSLNGTSINDTIYGLDGNDLLKGLGGSDTIYGGDGKDHVIGGGKADLLYGDAGSDTLEGKGGQDELYGGAGKDELHGDAGNDDLYGGGGQDTAGFSGPYSDYVFASSGNALEVTDTNADNQGNDGTDTLRGVETLDFGNHSLQTSDFDDFGPAAGGRTTLLPDSTDGNELWSGDGNTLTNFNIASNTGDGVEIALKAKVRQGPDIIPNGNEYDAPTGPQDTDNGSQVDNAARTAWSFDFSINTDTDNNGAVADLANVGIVIDFDVDKGAGVKYVNVLETTFAQYAAAEPDLVSTDGTVLDNSLNTAFFSNIAPYSPNDEGQYNLRLSVFDDATHHLLASTTIAVNVTDDFIPVT
jgi:hypothetical protein